MMEIVLTSGLLLWTLQLSLAGLVYRHHPRSLSNRAFSVFVLTVVGWSFCVHMVYMKGPQTTELLWGRMAFATASLIGSSFVVFCDVFPDFRTLQSTVRNLFFPLLGTLIAGLSLTPLVLRSVTLAPAGNVQRAYGLLYPLYGAFLVSAFGHGIWTLIQKWRVARGRSRIQIQYLWLGLSLALAGGTTTNLVIPALTGNSRFGLYGPYCSLILIGLTAHAIIRHRLMDIRLVIRQSVTYAVSMATAIGIIWGLVTLMRQGLGHQVQLSASSLPWAVAIAGALIFHPIRVSMQRLFDRYCYRHAYDYGQALKTISQALASVLRIDPLCEQLTDFLFATLKVEAVAVYLCSERSQIEQWSYHSVYPAPVSEANTVAPASPELIALLRRAGEPVVRDELARFAATTAITALNNTFARLRCHVIIPLLVEHEVAGFIAIGEKLSGDPFFTPDIAFLATVGHQAGVALKRAQLHEEVTWMKEYSDNILRYMESGLVVVDHESKITVVNDAAARMLGLAMGELVAQPIARLIPHGLGLPLLDTLLERTVYTNHETTLTPTAGAPLPVVLSTSILRGENGQAGGAILAVHDLSQVKALEEEKRRIERLASIGTFMSGIAHEIKNPLVAIKTLAELLPEQYDDPEFRDTFTKVTLNEVDRIDTLVRRLRSVSSGSAVPLQAMSVLTPLEETLSLLSGELTRRKITLTREYEEPLAPILGDHDQLKQVFVNLCLNSLEAMGEGGTLKVGVGSVSTHAGRPAELIIRIADTGPGIPAEHLAHIFDPFFTLKDEGTGLGLAICRGILDYHRGSIAASNATEGSGAIFTLTLPVAQGAGTYEIAVARR